MGEVCEPFLGFNLAPNATAEAGGGGNSSVSALSSLGPAGASAESCYEFVLESNLIMLLAEIVPLAISYLMIFQLRALANGMTSKIRSLSLSPAQQMMFAVFCSTNFAFMRHIAVLVGTGSSPGSSLRLASQFLSLTFFSINLWCLFYALLLYQVFWLQIVERALKKRMSKQLRLSKMSSGKVSSREGDDRVSSMTMSIRKDSSSENVKDGPRRTSKLDISTTLALKTKKLLRILRFSFGIFSCVDIMVFNVIINFAFSFYDDDFEKALETFEWAWRMKHFIWGIQPLTVAGVLVGFGWSRVKKFRSTAKIVFFVLVVSVLLGGGFFFFYEAFAPIPLSKEQFTVFHALYECSPFISVPAIHAMLLYSAKRKSKSRRSRGGSDSSMKRSGTWSDSAEARLRSASGPLPVLSRDGEASTRTSSGNIPRLVESKARTIRVTPAPDDDYEADSLASTSSAASDDDLDDL